MESAYRVLTSHAVDSTKAMCIFKLPYRLWNKGYLTEKFEQLSHGNLEDPSIPLFFTLGGAGTYYARMGNPQAMLPITSGPLPPPNTAYIPSPEEETSVAGSVSALGMNDEEWFDAHDVEG